MERATHLPLENAVRDAALITLLAWLNDTLHDRENTGLRSALFQLAGRSQDGVRADDRSLLISLSGRAGQHVRDMVFPSPRRTRNQCVSSVDRDHLIKSAADEHRLKVDRWEMSEPLSPNTCKIYVALEVLLSRCLIDVLELQAPRLSRELPDCLTFASSKFENWDEVRAEVESFIEQHNEMSFCRRDHDEHGIGWRMFIMDSVRRCRKILDWIDAAEAEGTSEVWTSAEATEASAV